MAMLNNQMVYIYIFYIKSNCINHHPTPSNALDKSSHQKLRIWDARPLVGPQRLRDPPFRLLEDGVELRHRLPQAQWKDVIFTNGMDGHGVILRYFLKWEMDMGFSSILYMDFPMEINHLFMGYPHDYGFCLWYIICYSLRTWKWQTKLLDVPNLKMVIFHRKLLVYQRAKKTRKRVTSKGRRTGPRSIFEILRNSEPESFGNWRSNLSLS